MHDSIKTAGCQWCDDGMFDYHGHRTTLVVGLFQYEMHHFTKNIANLAYKLSKYVVSLYSKSILRN